MLVFYKLLQKKLYVSSENQSWSVAWRAAPSREVRAGQPVSALRVHSFCTTYQRLAFFSASSWPK